jgi:hypothetical protein|tara:strand:- start:529 stop:777 length:249 start_codon:yes stop_codon:yes gene_type:complete
MNINLLIVYLDGNKKDVSAGAADIVAFEEKFDLSIARLEQNVKLTHLFFLAWHTEKRTGATKDDFNKWLELVSSIEAQEVKK